MSRAGRTPLQILGWVLPALFVLGLLPRIITFVQVGISRVAWPWQIDYAEGVNLNAAYLLSQGQNIYAHNGPDGFISAPYPPLFFLLTAPFQWLTGPSFGVGRTISLLFTMAVTFLIAYIVWKVVGNLAAAALAGGLWLTLSPVIVWSAFFKQDIPAMALDLAGVAWIMSAMSRKETEKREGSEPKSSLTRWALVRPPAAIVIAALFFTLAFYMKQSALTGAAATGLWLLVRDWRMGIRFGVTLCLMIFVPFFAVNFLLRGGLWEHLVGYHSLPQTGRRFTRSITALINEYWPILIIGGAGLVGAVVALFPRRDKPLVQDVRARVGGPLGLVAIYSVIGWAATLSKLGYEGANFNHLMDGLLPTCILVGICAAYLGTLLARRGSPTGLVAGSVGWAALAILLVAQILSFNPPQTWFTSGWPNEDKNREMLGLSRLVANTPGDMFSEDAYLLLSNSKKIIYEDASTFVPLADLHEWDDSAFNQSILDRRFSFIFLLQGNVRWTEQGLKVFGASYNLKFPGSIEAYEPKLFPSTPQYAADCDLAGSGQTIVLDGYSLPPGVAHDGAKAGETMRVQLWWHAVSSLTQNYASFVHMVNEKGDLVTGQDNPQTGAAVPTTQWQANTPITDTASLPVPADLAAGRYRLVAGMYHAENGTIQPLKTGCREGETFGDAVSLGWVDVKK
ncbi:MAG: hypothetical protein ABI670_14465 [Chloroflexota bacterium]